MGQDNPYNPNRSRGGRSDDGENDFEFDASAFGGKKKPETEAEKTPKKLGRCRN